MAITYLNSFLGNQTDTFLLTMSCLLSSIPFQWEYPEVKFKVPFGKRGGFSALGLRRYELHISGREVTWGHGTESEHRNVSNYEDTLVARCTQWAIRERQGKQGTSKLEGPREINASFNMAISKFRSLSPQQLITQRKLKQRHANALRFYISKQLPVTKKLNWVHHAAFPYVPSCLSHQSHIPRSTT